MALHSSANQSHSRYGAFSGPNKNFYYHELFLRGKAFLSLHLERKKIKGAASRRLGSREKEPDFSKLPVLPAAKKSDDTCKVPTEHIGMSSSTSAPLAGEILPSQETAFIRPRCVAHGTPMQAPVQSNTPSVAETNHLHAFGLASRDCHVSTSTLDILRRERLLAGGVPFIGYPQHNNLSQAMFLQLITDRHNAGAALSSAVSLQDHRPTTVQNVPRGDNEKRLQTARMLEEALQL
jgi:hypothetical protein